MAKAKAVKTGLRAGGGPPPGYHWSVHYLSAARNEAHGFLTDVQYAHVIDLFKALASEPDPTHPVTVTVETIENYYELKDKGGVLGKINLRVYFTVFEKERAIVVLAAIKKEADGQAPRWVKTRVRVRLRRFRESGFGGNA